VWKWGKVEEVLWESDAMTLEPLQCPACAQHGAKGIMYPQSQKGLPHTDGFIHDFYACLACGHTQYVQRFQKGGPCPNCGHVWAEPVRGSISSALAGEGF